MTKIYRNYTHLWNEFLPGPTISQSHQIRVIFRSDKEGTASGFKAYYKFVQPLRLDVPCDVSL